MANKIRLGFVGANVNSTWASQSHFPALLASPDVEFTAVCTTRPESAEEARQAFGAKLAFHDFRAMAVSPEIDAVAVVVRAPSHYEATKAAIEAGKHVYTEWPLGRNTAESELHAKLSTNSAAKVLASMSTLAKVRLWPSWPFHSRSRLPSPLSFRRRPESRYVRGSTVGRFRGFLVPGLRREDGEGTASGVKMKRPCSDPESAAQMSLIDDILTHPHIFQACLNTLLVRPGGIEFSEHFA